MSVRYGNAIIPGVLRAAAQVIVGCSVFFSGLEASSQGVGYGEIIEGPPQQAPAPIRICDSKQIFENMRWFQYDASNSSRSARVRSRILRASSVTTVGNAKEIKAAYKEGQQHNSHVASLIDQCDDNSIGAIAYQFAESVVRLKQCEDASPAASATCSDLAENLRWSLLDNKNCGVFARQFLTDAMQNNEYKKVRAERVRRAVQVSQGHRHDVAKSLDFIGDDLLLQIAGKIYRDYQVEKLDRRPADPDNPFTQQACPGVLLAYKFTWG